MLCNSCGQTLITPGSIRLISLEAYVLALNATRNLKHNQSKLLGFSLIGVELIERSFGAVNVSDLNENIVSTLVVLPPQFLQSAGSSALDTGLIYSDSELQTAQTY
jgi:hypothetical protein